MSAVVRVTELVRRYDEDAWIALANRGLLRRATKDLGALEVALLSSDDEAVVLAVGDREVTVPISGPAAATCTCPSTVVCQHVLTACLWLATDAPASDSQEGAAGPVDSEVLHEELMALDQADLVAYAGLPGVRWAHQLLADLDTLGEEVGVQRGEYLSVRLPRPDVTARYFGGGLDALALDQRVPQPQRVRAAAVLAWQRAHGKEQQPPPPLRGGSVGTALARTKADSRDRLRRAVTLLLTDTVRTGVSHLSAAVLDRYTTLAVWAQGAEYHRLAGHLRRLGDQVELILDRSARADDRRLLDDVVLAAGLVRALDVAAARGTEPSHLVGRARTGYDPISSLRLVGLGGLPWRTGSGYEGLTCLFWAPERGRFLTWTDARPEGVPGFDPRGRWRQPGPWGSLDSPSATCGHQVTLTGARVSPDGRLSGVDSTAARVAHIEGDDLATMLPVVQTWAELSSVDRSWSLLAAPGSADRWTVVRPSEHGEPYFDPARQVLVWPLFDTAGEVLNVEVAWSELQAPAIARIEELEALPVGALVVLRTRPTPAGVVGEPLSLVLPQRPAGPVDALHFADVSGEATHGTAPRGPIPEGVDAHLPAIPALVEFRGWLEAQAERGTAGADPQAITSVLARHHRALRGVGLHCFPEVDPSASHDPADLLIRSHYVLRQAELALL